jgi:hypothetical protein
MDLPHPEVRALASLEGLVEAWSRINLGKYFKISCFVKMP